MSNYLPIRNFNDPASLREDLYFRMRKAAMSWRVMVDERFKLAECGFDVKLDNFLLSDVVKHVVSGVMAEIISNWKSCFGNPYLPPDLLEFSFSFTGCEDYKRDFYFPSIAHLTISRVAGLARLLKYVTEFTSSVDFQLLIDILANRAAHVESEAKSCVADQLIRFGLAGELSIDEKGCVTSCVAHGLSTTQDSGKIFSLFKCMQHFSRYCQKGFSYNSIYKLADELRMSSDFADIPIMFGEFSSVSIRLFHGKYSFTFDRALFLQMVDFLRGNLPASSQEILSRLDAVVANFSIPCEV